MSILIKGMEMPQRCWNCPFANAYWDGLHCIAGGGFLIGRTTPIGAEKDKDCPLVPLPEGHGRLGDLDALMNNIGDVPYKSSVRRVLLSAPPIVPAEGGSEG